MSEALIQLKINEQTVLAPPGINLIEAAKLIGVEIPHFCYHPALCIAGNCRMCVVEVATLRTSPTGQPVLEWNPKLTIACNTTVVDGMEVKTHTPRVMEARKGVMEFLLINHPLDCPICDQAGECRLQELAVDYGQGGSRFVEEKEKKPKKVPLGPKIVLDDERCILCSRCVRFMRDVAKQDCLGFVDRGGHSTLTYYPDHVPDSNYLLNTIDLCPVGALTSVDFRFKQRVWFLKQTRSICPHCAMGCNTVISSREDVVYRQTPRDNPVVNGSWMCDAGRLNFHFINDTRRLKEPAVRLPGRPEPCVSWPAAIRQVTASLIALRDGGGDRIAFVGSARATTEELFLFRRLADVLKVSLMDIIPHEGPADTLLVKADRNPNTRGALLTGVAAPVPGSRIPQIAQGIVDGRIRALVVLGEDVSGGGIPRSLLEKLECLVVMECLPNDTTAVAHVLLPGATFAEKDGTLISGSGRMQRLNQAVAAPGQARPEWQTLAALLLEMGSGEGSSLVEIFSRMTKHVSLLEGLTLERVGSQGVMLNVE